MFSGPAAAVAAQVRDSATVLSQAWALWPSGWVGVLGFEGIPLTCNRRSQAEAMQAVANAEDARMATDTYAAKQAAEDAHGGVWLGAEHSVTPKEPPPFARQGTCWCMRMRAG